MSEKSAYLKGAAEASPGIPKRLFLAGVAALILWWLAYRSLLPLAKWLTYGLFNLSEGTHLASAVEFFLYDTPKVLLLLTLVVFAVGVIRSYFTADRARRILAGKREAAGNVMAALLGIVTPFCSCSAVPLFIGFVTAGVPLGVTFSFLISAPMVNEIALVLLFGLFGWKIAALYLGTGLLIAMIAGWTIGRIGMERHVEPWVYEAIGAAGESGLDEKIPFADRVRQGLDAVRDIVAGSGSTLSSASPWAPASTATSRRTSWPRSWGAGCGGRCRSRSSSASRCTRTPPGSSR